MQPFSNSNLEFPVSCIAPNKALIKHLIKKNYVPIYSKTSFCSEYGNIKQTTREPFIIYYQSSKQALQHSNSHIWKNIIKTTTNDCL